MDQFPMCVYCFTPYISVSWSQSLQVTTEYTFFFVSLSK